MKVQVYDNTGKEKGTAELPSAVFEVEMNPSVIHQVYVTQMGNKRQSSAHTKDRGEVSGGGRKPWRQKGTGRARHGSNRSPIWRGGGVTFGPTNAKEYKRSLNKNMRRKALCMVLSEKAKNSRILVVDGLQAEDGKTKTMDAILRQLPCKDATRLLALPEMDQKTIFAARNIKKTDTIQARDLNVADLMRSMYIVMPKESIDVITQICTKTEKPAESKVEEKEPTTTKEKRMPKSSKKKIEKDKD